MNVRLRFLLTLDAPRRRLCRWITAGTVVVMATNGCSPQIPRVTPELVAIAVQRDATTTPELLENGRAIYLNRCASCHDLSAPDEFSEREWRSQVRKMAPKARINNTQQTKLLAFLLTAREAANRAHESGHQTP